MSPARVPHHHTPNPIPLRREGSRRRRDWRVRRGRRGVRQAWPTSSLCVSWPWENPKTAQGSSAITQQIRVPPGHKGAGEQRKGAWRRRGAASDPKRRRWRRRAGRVAGGCHTAIRGETRGGAAIRKHNATVAPRKPISSRLGAAVGGRLGTRWQRPTRGRRRGGRGVYTPGRRPGRTTMTARGGAGLILGEGIKEVRAQEASGTTRKPTPRKSEGLYRPDHPQILGRGQ